MAESFVVLQTQSGGGAGPPGDALSTLSRVFELASDATKIDQPMCIECAQQLREELDAQVRSLRPNPNKPLRARTSHGVTSRRARGVGCGSGRSKRRRAR